MLQLKKESSLMTITKSKITWGGRGARKIVSRPVRMPGVLIHVQAQVLVFVDHRHESNLNLGSPALFDFGRSRSSVVLTQ